MNQLTLPDIEYSNRKKKTKREEFFDAMRPFMHIDFNEQQVPDATTLLHFRHMLEANRLGEKIFADVTHRLDKAGLMMHGGTIVDASLIAASKSTKNQEGKHSCLEVCPSQLCSVLL